MKRILLILALSVSLGGCATLRTSYDVVTGATISPTAVIVAANGFDALEATATNYLRLKSCAVAPGPVCRNKAATKAIIPAIRSGRLARNKLEAFMVANPGKLGNAGLYNALTEAIATLQGVFVQYNVGG